MRNTDPVCRVHRLVGICLAFGLVVAAGCGEQEDPGKTVVGVYRAQEVLMEYPGVKDLRETAQDSIRGAQEDENKIRRLQRKFYNQQKDLFEEYQHNLQKTIPQLARKKNLDMVVVEEAVQFQSDSIVEKDITKELIRAVREKVDGGQAAGYFDVDSE